MATETMSHAEPVTPVNLDYPINLRLAGRSVLVVGAGHIAARKIGGLLLAAADVTVVAPVISDAVADFAAADRTVGQIAIVQRNYETADLDGMWFVVEATGDPAVAAQIYADAETARIFCNAADKPVSCSATLPAVHRQGSLSIAYSTGGTSPAVAAWLRAGAGSRYGAEYGILTELTAQIRASARRLDIPTEALDWRSVLNSGILEEVQSGQISRAKERLEAWLSSSSE